VSLRKITDAPSSTKNKAGARNPEMSSNKKGKDWYLGSVADRKLLRGIKVPTNAHIGVDADSGATHSLDTSTAKVHDNQVWDGLLHGAPMATACQGRASLPGHQTPVRPCEDPLPGPRQEPRPALHAVRARQPVSDATQAGGMRTRLPE